MLIDFYLVHYNFGAVVLLIVMLVVFLLMKKNYKLAIMFIAALIAFNVVIYNKTAGKTWTREFYRTDEVVQYPVWDRFDSAKVKVQISDTNKVTFAASSKVHPWVVYSETGDTLRHWCWWDEAWELFSQTDLVAWIWGENAGKKVRGSSEERLNGKIE